MNTSEYTKALEASLQTALREIERLKIEKAVAEHNLHFFAANNRMHLRMPNDLKSPRDFLTIMFMHLE